MTLIEAAWDDARAAAVARAREIMRPSPSFIAVHEGAGRTLAHDATAKCALPPFDTSAMDGWAVSGNGPWRIVGDALAGTPYRGTLEPSTCVRIATGAVVPDGATAVLRSERAKLRGDEVAGEAVDGQDIRRAGEECAAGELLIGAGTLLTPAHLGFLAAAGHDTIEVAAEPRVAVVVLGDELLDHGVPADGRIRDALGPQLPAWLRSMGARVVDVQRVADDEQVTIDALRSAAGTADVVITTGGTARGPRDTLRAALNELGALIVDHVRVRPGHPMLLADIGVPVIGLPGNPHSALVGLMTLAAPMLDAMLGRISVITHVPAHEALNAAGDSTRVVAGTLVDGQFTGAPFTGSAMLRGLADSTGMAIVPKGGIQAGELVRWMPFPYAAT